jgi:hypothetical protein
VFADLDGVPREVELRLVDHVLDRTIDLRRDTTYRFVSPRSARVARASEARFELLAGTPEFIATGGAGTSRPLRTRLSSVFPSPMASATTIRFEIARPGITRLQVFDVAGRCVRTLLHEPRLAGLHELSWKGDDEGGRSLPPGIYLVRLVAPDRHDERRVVKIR